MNREIKRIVDEAAERGWLREPSRKNHVKLRHPVTNKLVVMASTPSDCRALLNIRAELRRAEKQAGV